MFFWGLLFSWRIKGSYRRRLFNTQLFSKVIRISFQLFLPVHIDKRLGLKPVLDSPRNINLSQSLPFRGLETQGTEDGGQRCDGQSHVCPFEPFEGNFALDNDGKAADAVIKVVAFSIPLHHVGQFWIIYISYLALSIHMGCGVGIPGLGCLERRLRFRAIERTHGQGWFQVIFVAFLH